MTDPAIADALKASQAEQLPLTVHFKGASATGIVSRLDEGTVELRSPQGRSRTVILLERIDAVRVD